MQCPLCRENVADDNALQVHYLMSCLGYLENPSANKKNETISKKIVQFRWVKSKPTLAREVYLISSLAGSVKLKWQEIDECFLSEQVEVLQGLHSCQLVVDGDSLSTVDFNVSDSSRTINVFVSEAEEPGSNLSESDDHESQVQPTSHGNQGDDKDKRTDVPALNLPSKGSLYRELLTHQILHGDSLETLTGSSHVELGKGSEYQIPGTRGNHQRERRRASDLAERNYQDKTSRNTHETDITQSHRSLTGYDDVTRNDGDQPSERDKNDVPLRDSINSDELEQFLQPTRTRQENEIEEDNADNEVGTTEERESSHSDIEEISVSISSNGDFESRPELPGQSNGENNESRVQLDRQHDVSNRVPAVGGDETRITNRQQSSDIQSQETLLIDLREPASGDNRQATSARREMFSGHDRENSLANHHKESSSNDSRRTSDDRRNGMSNGHHAFSVKGREETSADLSKQLSENDFRRLSDDHRDLSLSVHRKPLSVEREGSNGLLSETSGESLSHLRKQSGADRERTPGVDHEQSSLRNRKKPYGHHREESSGVDRERSSGVDRETTSNVRGEETTRDLGNDSLAGHRDSNNDGGRNSDDHRETPINNRYLGDVRTEISGDLRQETSKGIQERTSSDNYEPTLDDNRETSDNRREQTSGNRRDETLDGPREESFSGREDISESTAQNNANNSDESALSVSTSGFLSLPTTLSPGITQYTQSEVFVNSLGTGDIRTSRQEQQSTPEARDTEDLISPRVAATSPPISLEGAIPRTSALTDDLLFRSYSTSSSTLRTDLTFSSQHTSAPSKYTSAPSRNTSAVNKGTSASIQYSIPPSTNTSAQRQNASAQRREIARSNVTIDPTRRSTAPRIATSAPSGNSITSSRETGTLSRQTSTPTITTNTQSGGKISPRRVISASSINTNAPSRDNMSQGTSTQSYNPQNVSSFSIVDSYPSYTRRSPQGSFFSDNDVRRPPLYTSAPSRPYSSLPHTPPAVISPLNSPRNGDEAVSSPSKPATSTGTISNELQSRATLLTSQSILDRQTPTGSALSPEGAHGGDRGSSGNTMKFSEDSIKELLDSLKKESSRRPNTSSPETSPREKLGTSEVALKVKLAEREDYIKKLKARNAAYKEKIDDLREKEIELTKALSLAEPSQQALKEQEEIARELTNALGEKEKQYAELELNAREAKIDCRRLKSELEHVKKGYENKIKELERNNVSLEQEVKKLRENSARFSPRSSTEYKKLLEQYLESRAVADSLKDHAKKLEKENKVLQEKINALVKISRTKQDYTRDPYSTRMDGSLGTSRGEQPTTSINGYPDRIVSPTLLGRQKSDGFRGQTDSLRRRTDNDHYHLDSQRDYTGNPYDSHRSVLENTRYQPEPTDYRRDRSRPQSASPRSRYEEFQRHSESSQKRSDGTGSEIFNPSSHMVRDAWGAEQRNRRRVATAGDVMSSEVPDTDYRQWLSKRSYSSDSIRNGFPDGVQSNISPSREKGRSKDKTRLTHAGSYDNLLNRTEASGLTLTGRRVGHSPTSPSSTSPRGDRRSSPGTPFAPETPQQIDQGMIVLVSRQSRGLSRGVVRYVGHLPTKGDKIYLGLELHDKDGKHDGRFNGQRFFKCKPNHGIFVPYDKVVMAYA